MLRAVSHSGIGIRVVLAFLVVGVAGLLRFDIAAAETEKEVLGFYMWCADLQEAAGGALRGTAFGGRKSLRAVSRSLREVRRGTVGSRQTRQRAATTSRPGARETVSTDHGQLAALMGLPGLATVHSAMTSTVTVTADPVSRLSSIGSGPSRNCVARRFGAIQGGINMARAKVNPRLPDF